MTDIVIPLSTESNFDNMLLRIALRSILKYASNLGNIHIVTSAKLPWIRNCNIIYQEDTLKHLKDVNLINKIRSAASSDAVALNFLFWSDDQVLAAPLDLDKAPIVSNNRTIEDFKLNPTKWQSRLCNTFNYVLKQTSKKLPYNYDSHVPQPYTKQGVEEIFSKVPYTLQPGFCINTIYYGMLQKAATVRQEAVKLSFLSEKIRIPKKLPLYIGYNDTALQKGLYYFLLGMFYDKSSFLYD